MGTIAIAAAALLALSACSPDPANDPSESGAEAPTGALPVTVTTCGIGITLEKAPERVMPMGATGVEAMRRLGVFDRTIAHSGPLDTRVFNQEVVDHVASITKLEKEKSDSGGGFVSTEAILGQRVDLFIGFLKEKLAAL